MHCPHCDADNARDARFCGRCGHLLQTACPACGADTIAGQLFCTACGHDLARPAASTPPTTEDGVVDAARASSAGSPSSTGSEEGERRQATVVFADLAGYTALTEQGDPEDVEALLI